MNIVEAIRGQLNGCEGSSPSSVGLEEVCMKDNIYKLGILITFLSFISLRFDSDLALIMIFATGIGMVLSGYGNN